MIKDATETFLYLRLDTPDAETSSKTKKKKKTQNKKKDEESKDSSNIFVLKASIRKLVFNDKDCRILILKNLTSIFEFKRANDFGESMKMLTATVSHEMRLPLQSVSGMCSILLSWSTSKQVVEVIKTI